MEMAEHPTAALIRDLYAAFFAGDMETVSNGFADDIIFHVPGRSPLSGTYYGKDQVFAMFTAEAELLSDVKTEIHDVLGSDDHVVVLKADSVTRNGRTWSGSDVDVMHVKDGKIAEFWNVFPDVYGYDELLNS